MWEVATHWSKHIHQTYILLYYLEVLQSVSKISFDECVPVATHWSKHIHRNTFLLFGGVAKLQHLQILNIMIKKGLAFFFDECVSTNV